MAILAPVGSIRPQFFDDSGNVLSGGLIYFYAAGTETPLDTYTTQGGGTANANPVVLDSDGRAANGIWFAADRTYKVIAKTSAGVTLWTEDNVSGISGGYGQYLTSVAGTNTITGTSTPAPGAYAAGQEYTFTPANSNTGAATLNVSSLGAKNIFRNNVALTGNELQANVPVKVVYDGTQFQILGNDGWIYVYKRANETIQSTTTLQDDDALFFSVAANVKYVFEIYASIDSNVTPDFKFNLSGPGSETLERFVYQIWDANGLIEAGTRASLGGSNITISSNSGGEQMEIRGVLHNGAVAGTLNFQWAQVTSDASDTTVHAGSYLRFKVIA